MVALERVTVQRRGMSQSSTGQLSETWTDIYTVGAKVSLIEANRSSSTKREISYAQYRVTVPYSSSSIALTTQNAAMLNGIRYDIDHVDRDTKWRKQVVIILTERNQEGTS